MLWKNDSLMTHCCGPSKSKKAKVAVGYSPNIESQKNRDLELSLTPKVLGMVSGLVLLAFAGWIFFQYRPDLAWRAPPPDVSGSAIVLKTDQGEGNVTVAIGWRKEEGLVFDLYLDTHSIDLTSFDVLQGVVLEKEGSTYVPVGWQEDSGSSHHREGTLSFEENFPDGFELIVKDLSGVPERRFEW